MASAEPEPATEPADDPASSAPDDAAPPADPPSSESAPRSGNGRRPLLIGGIVVLVLAAIGLVWAFVGSGSGDGSEDVTVHAANEKLCDGLPEAAGAAWHSEEDPTVDSRAAGGVDTVTCLVRYVGDSTTDGAVSLTAEVSVSYYPEVSEAEGVVAPQLLPPNLVEAVDDLPGDWDQGLAADVVSTGATATTGLVLRSGNTVAVVVLTLAGGEPDQELSDATVQAVEAARDSLAAPVLTAAISNGESD